MRNPESVRTTLASPSPVSRVRSIESGEPLVKLYPKAAASHSEATRKDLILAVAVVLEDVKREGLRVEKYQFDPYLFLAPNIFGNLNSREIRIYVRVARLETPILEAAIPGITRELSKDDPADSYFAPVSLMPVENGDGFFVNYRGCQMIL
jgi:hypothetical protein